MSTLDKATRALNRAEVADHLPVPDYLIRYDFSRASETGPTKVQYQTDEATNDIDQIWSENDVQTMEDVGAPTTFPSLEVDSDGFPCIYFPGDGGLRNTVSLGAVDKTVFMVWKAPITAGSYLYAAQFGAVSFGARFTTDADSPFIRGNATDFYSTNAFDDRRLISSFTNTHVATDDNDLEYWVGKTSQGTSLTAADSGVTSTYVSLGAASGGNQELPDTYIYEIIQYDRVLTTAEREAVVDYLSAKWQVSNIDSTTDIISEKVSARVPTDYGMRWDASTPAGIDYLTDEATNDVNSWADETGTLTLDTIAGTSGTYPAYLRDSDGLPHLRFYATRSLYKAYDAAYDGATDMTVFMVTQSDSADQSAGNRYTVGGPGEFHGAHQGGTTNPPGTLYDGLFYNPTNDFDSRRVIFSHRNVYNGAADNDADIWCGKTNIHTATAKADANGIGYVTMGGYSFGTTWQCDCKIYEYVVFLRALSDAEHAAWVDYLSAKWQANNFDYATDSSTPTTSETWTTRFIDEKGTAATGTPIKHVIKPLGEEGAPKVSGTTHYNKEYAANPTFAGITVSTAYYFNAAQTEGMNFVTGDAKAGGTVDSWVDVTGAVTMDTASTGEPADSAVNYTPNARGFPAIYGGNSVTPRSLESTATITSANSKSRIAWSVVGHVLGDTNSAPCGLVGNLWFPERDDNDDVSRMGMTGTEGNKTYGIPGSGGSGITINVWLIDHTGGSPYDTWRFTQGYRHPEDTATTNPGNFRCSVGALATSNFDSEGYVYEMGMNYWNDADGFPTDAEIEEFILSLCNKYGVDFMPDLTPWIVGAEQNSTSNYSLFGMPYWYRADQQLVLDSGNITDWDLHPLVAAQHTSGDRNMNTTDSSDNPPEKVVNMLDRDAATFVSSNTEHLQDATTYTWTEATDFNPTETGISTFVVGRNNAKTSDGYMWDGAASMRQSTTTGKIQFRASANNVDGLSDENGNWVIAIGTYDTSSGDQNLYVNADAVQNTTDASASSPSATTPNVGGSNASANLNDCDLLEVAEFKFVLTDVNIANLQRYARYRYRETSDFGF